MWSFENYVLSISTVHSVCSNEMLVKIDVIQTVLLMAIVK